MVLNQITVSRKRRTAVYNTHFADYITTTSQLSLFLLMYTIPVTKRKTFGKLGFIPSCIQYRVTEYASFGIHRYSSYVQNVG